MVTRKDVAQRAGVSVTIVSRVLNESGYVAHEKREAVQQAARELNYQPNPVALSLKKSRTRQILYYVSDLSNYFYMELYKGMMDYAQMRDYLIVISGALNPSQIGRLMIDGMVLPNEFYSSEIFTQEIVVPVVVASHGQNVNPRFANVDADTAQAMQIAVDHLRVKGHQRIAFASMYLEDKDNPRHRRFYELMQPILGKHTHQYILGNSQTALPVHDVNYFENGKVAGRQFIERNLDATAIICFNDDTAIGLMSVLYSHGIRVPDQVSIMGIDGQFEGEYTSPPLSTVSLNPYEQGRLCAELLIDQIDKSMLARPDPLPAQTISLPLQLIERGSIRDITQIN